MIEESSESNLLMSVCEIVNEMPLEVLWLGSGVVKLVADMSGISHIAHAASLIFHLLTAYNTGYFVGEVITEAPFPSNIALSILVGHLGYIVPYPWNILFVAAVLLGTAHRTLKKEQPSLSKPPEESFDEVVPLGNSKEKIQEIVSYLRYPEPFIRLGVKPPRGVLISGPPGTGKTLIAKALAHEIGPYTVFIQTTGSKLKSKWMGESSEKIHQLFDQAKKSLEVMQMRIDRELGDGSKSFCLIFIDEIDSFRSREYSGPSTGGPGHTDHVDTVNALLAEMDGFNTSDRILVAGATNHADQMDQPLLSRFPWKMQTHLPNLSEREEIFEVHLRKTQTDADVDLKELARLTQGRSGRDIKYIVERALWTAGTQRRLTLGQAQLLAAINNNRDPEGDDFLVFGSDLGVN